MDLRTFSLTTDRLLLRAATQDDAPALQALMTPGISRWVAAWPHPLPLSRVEEILSDAVARAAEGLYLPLVIIERAGGSVIGWIKLEVVTSCEERGGEIGYWIGEEAQGRGYAREAAGALMEAAFDRLGLDFVEAGAQPSNQVSHRLLAKLGMRSIGERMVYAPARGTHGTCLFWRADRPSS